MDLTGFLVETSCLPGRSRPDSTVLDREEELSDRFPWTLFGLRGPDVEDVVGTVGWNGESSVQVPPPVPYVRVPSPETKVLRGPL